MYKLTSVESTGKALSMERGLLILQSDELLLRDAIQFRRFLAGRRMSVVSAVPFCVFRNMAPFKATPSSSADGGFRTY